PAPPCRIQHGKGSPPPPRVPTGPTASGCSGVRGMDGAATLLGDLRASRRVSACLPDGRCEVTAPLPGRARDRHQRSREAVHVGRRDVSRHEKPLVRIAARPYSVLRQTRGTSLAATNNGGPSLYS